eukprot:5136567-Amphidinium_carterae.2
MMRSLLSTTQGDLAYVLATAEWAKQRAQEDGTLQQLDIYGHPTWLKTLNDEDEESSEPQNQTSVE